MDTHTKEALDRIESSVKEGFTEVKGTIKELSDDIIGHKIKLKEHSVIITIVTAIIISSGTMFFRALIFK